MESRFSLSDPVQMIKDFYRHSAKLGYAQESIQNSNKIDSYHALAWHLVDDYDQVGFARDDISVIPHFYDERFCSEASSNSSPINLLYVGKLEEKKGPHILINALSEASFDFQLRIAGSGPKETNLKQLVQKHGLSDCVTFLGFIPYKEVPAVFADADVFIYPGTWPEPFGRVFLEALASNTPVVTSDVGSAKRIIGEGGVSYDPGNEQGIREGIKTIMNSYPEYINGCESRIQRFEPETIIEQFNQFYVETCRQNH